MDLQVLGPERGPSQLSSSASVVMFPWVVITLDKRDRCRFHCERSHP